MNYFVIGDIHGCDETLEQLLTHWNPDSEQLIFLGDYIDRGKKSLDVLLRVKRLHETYGAIALGGNHEDLFLDWLAEPNDDQFYYNLGGRETVDSFFEERVTFQQAPSKLAQLIQVGFSDVVSFLQNRPAYYETKDSIFVHAGVDLYLADWKNSHPNTFKWVREPFIHEKNETGKTIYFGHTPTDLLHQDQSHDVWVSPCGTKIGIDGGCVFGGNLHGVALSNNQRTIYSVPKQEA